MTLAEKNANMISAMRARAVEIRKGDMKTSAFLTLAIYAIEELLDATDQK